MKFVSEDKIYHLHDDLNVALANYRKVRDFNVETYVEAKITKINQYMNEYELKSCVVAISGGIDSAITYGLIMKAMQCENSPIQKVVPIFLPVYKSEGATNQETARNKADELIQAFGGETVKEIDISKVHELLKSIVEKSMNITGEPWASGQLVSYLRTPTYYYVTSLLSEQGYSPIVCGTTNRDEGAYLGYFGKASDGMVDVQLISDLHKSEAYEVAQYLSVPLSIIEAVPTGDMYDNRSDEDVFGATYDFVELYLHYLNLNDLQKFLFKQKLSSDALQQFLILQKNLEDMHKYNKHKYLGASPAIHMDVIEAKVQGGWMYNNYEGAMM